MFSRPMTIAEKIYESHIVKKGYGGSPDLLYIDLHLIHEVTSPQAFSILKERNLKVARPNQTLAVADHCTPTIKDSQNKWQWSDEAAHKQVVELEANCEKSQIRCLSLESDNQGIVHVVAPELGVSRPGMTIVCGDSHTSTHGAFGALAFGIGTTEVSHVLATQCLLQHPSKQMAVEIKGKLKPTVSAKDLVLYLIQLIKANGATGHVIEYRGDAIEALSMEERMTVCNMSIEAGARAGIIAPDETTWAWLAKCSEGPNPDEMARLKEHCAELISDDDATYHQTFSINAEAIRPMITWGTSPAMGLPLGMPLPDKLNQDEVKAMQYMGFNDRKNLIGTPVDLVFIGSCTNGRISDLRQVAEILKGHKVSKEIQMIIVPGSKEVKRQAEQEGLSSIFLEAGAEWRESGCSMCNGMNGDILSPGKISVSTSNRNFAGRQGPNSKTLLASPATAAHIALHGSVQVNHEMQQGELN